MNVEKNDFIEIVENPTTTDGISCNYGDGSIKCAHLNLGSSLAKTMSGELVID